ncbi:G-protein coupled receptor dmsr-1-like [Mya arenaria]|uniref:G-protein coupled receptor dmsr-1-like n=1 Tax=Mya arenaria TaxID=6604 RepID=UPI0022E4FDB8|nr:G-protein coupled receptor dmsr-1-like [Mya arenaria]
MAWANVSNITVGPADTHNAPKYIDSVSFERLQTLKERYADIHGYVSTTVCVVGVLLNIANIVVLNKKHMRTSTNIILMWLAVADLCTMVEYVPFALKFYVFKDEGLPSLWHVRSYSWMCYLLFHANFSTTMHAVSIWLTIMLATFRFIYIFFLDKASKYCSIHHAKMVILVVYMSAVVVCIPNYISNYWELTNQTANNETVHTFSQRRNGNYIYIFDMNYWVQSILIKLFPCVLLTLLTIMLITALHRAHRNHVHLKSQGMRRDDMEKHNEHFRTTAMLLAVVILFLVTELPQGIMTLLMIFMEELHNELYSPLGDILDIAALLNNAINFVLYCTMSQQFRDTFIQTFCSRCCVDEGQNIRKYPNNSIIRANNRKQSKMGDMV